VGVARGRGVEEAEKEPVGRGSGGGCGGGVGEEAAAQGEPGHEVVAGLLALDGADADADRERSLRNISCRPMRPGPLGR
jgi:hypothetical protein